MQNLYIYSLLGKWNVYANEAKFVNSDSTLDLIGSVL